MSISMIRQCSSCYKSECKNKEAASSGIQNMSGSTDQEGGSTDQDTDLQILIKV